MHGCLDSGSVLVAMNYNMWKDLKVPYYPDSVINMESANDRASSTLGCVHNLCVTIGPISLFLQVHIVCKSPFNLLLGQPFLTLLKCQSLDLLNGDQQLMLTCPNTTITIIIPTQNWAP
ncbi:hypothetical protein DACRYDRAFT_54398 [Dacryopinax primogenitus]|uniref:Aspartic peptidase DDI1-type domain-containing protein n=1 Tax=Dacryopinax primogenitus (strain DJM 731) TaxID=1858805 RepID=M5G3A1_DACPD|nr:uncharacterized protein DACRYDRAFT_54398 [Dacryopinax primogenitus]EJU00357.1 hypothetical protein DACRYDRAFT_54398 [Dacryopinax primogenitus]